MRPMLAHPFNAKRATYPAYVMPKIDGIRAIWTGTALLTRTGKPILSVPHIITLLERNYKNSPLDGELYNHDLTFEEICGIVKRTKNFVASEMIDYHVFDVPVPNLTFAERFADLMHPTKWDESWHYNGNGLRSVDCIEIFSAEDIDTHHLQARASGWEGLMYRRADSLYEFGKRSYGLMKIKSTLDAEFTIVGVTQLKTFTKLIVPEGTPGSKRYVGGQWYKDTDPKLEEMAGAVVVQTDTEQRFEVGTGLTDELRIDLWKNLDKYLGQKLTVKYQELTADGVPRFPVWKSLRNYE